MSGKDEKLFVRLTTELRTQVKREAALRGEAESVIVREALREYFTQKEGVELREKPVTYKKKP